MVEEPTSLKMFECPNINKTVAKQLIKCLLPFIKYQTILVRSETFCGSGLNHNTNLETIFLIYKTKINRKQNRKLLKRKENATQKTKQSYKKERANPPTGPTGPAASQAGPPLPYT